MDSFADLPGPTSARQLIVARDGFEPPNRGVRVLCLTTWRTGNKQDAFVFVFYQLSYSATRTPTGLEPATPALSEQKKIAVSIFSTSGRTRTFNPRIKSPLRYQLRHSGI